MNDLKTFERIVEEIQPAIYLYCFKKLHKNKELTDEAVNSTLNVLYQKWDTLDINDNIKAYAYRVADNCVMQVLEIHKKYYSRNESFEDFTEKATPDKNLYYDRYFDDKDDRTDEYIEKIKNSLPPEYTQLFVYRYIEKRTVSEIAELTGMKYSTLRLRFIKIEKLVKEEVRKIFY